MNAQFITIMSGVVLLLVIVLVGWNLRRRKSSGIKDKRKEESP